MYGAYQAPVPGDLEGMDELKEKWGISAWKTYASAATSASVVAQSRRLVQNFGVGDATSMLSP
jgi:hypothetical protein